MNRGSFLGTMGYSVITLALLGIVIFPFPPAFIDFLVTINIIFSGLLFLEVYLNRNNSEYVFSSKTLTFFSVFNIGINILITRLIFTIGEDFGSHIILFLSAPLAKIKTEILAAVLFVFAGGIVLFIYLLDKNIRRVTEITNRFAFDTIHKKMLAIEAEYAARTITDEESAARKNEIREEADYYIALNESGRFMAVYERVRLVFLFVNTVGGIIIGTKFRGEFNEDAYGIYISLALSSGFFTIIPSIVLFFALRFVILSLGRKV
jgi:flagellar biosynthesis protein FlhA